MELSWAIWGACCADSCGVGRLLGRRWIELDVVAVTGFSFVSVITLISIIGVTLGVAVLIIVMSVMSGFDLMLRERLLNFNSHIKVFSEKSVMTEYSELRETV